jgi:hypothetical protein
MDILCLFWSLLCSENPKQNNEALMAAAYIAGAEVLLQNDRRKHL